MKMRWAALTVAAVLLAAIVPAQADVIYLNNFCTGNTDDDYLSNVYMVAYGSNSAGNLVDRSSTKWNGGVDNLVGRGVRTPESYNTPSTLNGPHYNASLYTQGYIYSSPTATKFLDFTAGTTGAIDRSAWSIADFQWYQKGTPTDSWQRLAVKIADAWYVSSTQFAGPGTGIWTQQTLNFTTASSDWQTLTFTLGQPAATNMVIGSNTALPSGNIQAFGILGTSGTISGWNYGLDSLTVNGTEVPPVPAPIVDAGGPYELLAGGSVDLIATVVNADLAGEILEYEWYLGGSNIETTDVATLTLDWATAQGLGWTVDSDYEIQVRALNAIGWSDLSSATVHVAAPEPATMAFLAIGGIGLIGGAIRRRRTA